MKLRSFEPRLHSEAFTSHTCVGAWSLPTRANAQDQNPARLATHFGRTLGSAVMARGRRQATTRGGWSFVRKGTAVVVGEGIPGIDPGAAGVVRARDGELLEVEIEGRLHALRTDQVSRAPDTRPSPEEILEMLRQYLADMAATPGGRVDDRTWAAWRVTHPRAPHVGALNARWGQWPMIREAVRRNSVTRIPRPPAPPSPPQPRVPREPEDPAGPSSIHGGRHTDRAMLYGMREAAIANRDSMLSISVYRAFRAEQAKRMRALASVTSITDRFGGWLVAEELAGLGVHAELPTDPALPDRIATEDEYGYPLDPELREEVLGEVRDRPRIQAMAEVFERLAREMSDAPGDE